MKQPQTPHINLETIGVNPEHYGWESRVLLTSIWSTEPARTPMYVVTWDSNTTRYTKFHNSIVDAADDKVRLYQYYQVWGVGREPNCLLVHVLYEKYSLRPEGFGWPNGRDGGYVPRTNIPLINYQVKTGEAFYNATDFAAREPKIMAIITRWLQTYEEPQSDYNIQ